MPALHSSSPPGTQARPLRRVRAATGVGAALLAGCGVLNPVPDAALGGRLAPRAPGTAAAAGQPLTAAATVPACANSASFVGALDVAVCEVDARRLGYLQRSADVLNGQANYNALLWPLGAVAVYEKLRGAPNAKLLLPAVLGTAAYGFVSSGIPDRQKVYLDAARQLACAIVAAGPDLYQPHEIDPLPGPVQTPRTLRGVLVDLGHSVDAYEGARADLLAMLKPRPGTAAVAGSNDVFGRWQAAAGGRAATKGEDSRGKVATETQARLVQARAQLALGQALLRRLESGAPAAALLGRAARIDAQVQQQLADKAPPPANPASAAAEFKALARATLTLQANIDGATAAALPDPLDAALPVAIFDGLDAGSQQRLQQFQQLQMAHLRKASQHVGDWLARHRAGQQDAGAALEQAGCSAGAVALPEAIKAATDAVNAAAANAAGRPRTSNSPGTANGSSSAPPTGTSLDKP
jgi:hypothetical protein